MVANSFSRQLISSPFVIIIALLIGAACVQPLNAQNTFNSGQPGYPNWSPWSDIRWEDGKPVVKVNGEWSQLVSIHGVSVEELLTVCEENGWWPEKRISEDIVQMLRKMGHEIDRTTDLELIDDSGVAFTLSDLEMTVENRNQIGEADNIPAPVPLVIVENPFLSNAPGYPSWAAFSGIKWEGENTRILVDETWYDLLTIHNISIDNIREMCIENNWNFEHRFTEDHVQLIRLMGHEIDKTTSLALRDETGKLHKIEIEMTAEKLDALQNNDYESLSRNDILEDIDAFQQGLEQQFAYLNTNGVDYQSALDSIREQIPEQADKIWLANELQKVMSMFIDGHAGVSGTSLSAGYLPFLMAPSNNGLIAFRPDRSALLDDEFPFIRSIDGLEMKDWLAATESGIASGSAQFRLRHGLRHLRAIEHFRKKLGIENQQDLTLELVSADGKSSKIITRPISGDGPIFGKWPPVRGPEITDDNFGYLRIESMNDDAVSLLQKWMPEFEETDGLIIDVRGNGGGSRKALLELAGYLMTSEDTPRIGNVAKYRLFEEFDEQHLSGARFVYRESSSRFGENEREAIEEFRRNFQPEWIPPENEFSQWHYLVLSKSEEDRRYDYRKPVTILMDEYCFSATDIFLGAFKGWPNVTLVGTASGGGSARRQDFDLPNSDISIDCASMASFQPDGKLYDTRGIEPDVVVDRPPGYYVQGGPDVILDRAIEIIKTRNNPEDNQIEK